MADDAVARISVRVLPDTKGFRQKTESEIKKAIQGLKAQVRVEPDLDGFRQKIQAATKGLKAQVDIDANTKGLRTKIDAATKGHKSKVDVEVKETGLASTIAKIKLLRTMVKQRVRVNAIIDGDALAAGAYGAMVSVRGLTQALARLAPMALLAGAAIVALAGPLTALSAGGAMAILGAWGAIGATIGAISTAGITAGFVVMAARSEEVKNAWAETKTSIAATIDEVNTPVESSLVDLAPKVADAFKQIQPNIARVSEGVSTLIDRFGGTLPQLAEALGTALEQAFEAGRPAMESLIDGLPAIVTGFGNALQIIGESAAVQRIWNGMIEGLPGLLESTARGFDNAARGAGALYDWFKSPALAEFRDGMSQVWDELKNADWSKVVQGAEDILNAMGRIAANTDVQKLVDGFGKLGTGISRVMDLFNQLGLAGTLAFAVLGVALRGFATAFAARTASMAAGGLVSKIFGKNPGGKATAASTAIVGPLGKVGAKADDVGKKGGKLPGIFSRLGTAAGGSAGGVGQAASKMGIFGRVLRIASMGIRFLMGPIGWLITAALLIATNWDTVGPIVSKAFDGIKNAASSAMEAINRWMQTPAGQQLVEQWNRLKEMATTAWNGIKEVVGTAIDGIKGFLNTPLGEGLITGLSTAFNGLVSMIQGVLVIIRGVFEVIIGIFSGDGAAIAQGWASIWEGLSTLFSGWWDLIKGLASAGWNFVKTLFMIGLAFVQSIWNTGWNLLTTVVSTVWNFIVSIVTTGWNLIMTAIQIGITIITTIWNTGWNLLTTVVSTVWNLIVTVVTMGFTMIMAAIQMGITIITTIWNMGWNLLTTVVSTVWNFITSIISGAISVISSIVSTGISMVTSIWNAGWNAVKSVVSSVWNGIKSLISSAISTVSSVISSGMSTAQSVMSSAWSAIQALVSAAWSAMTSAISNGVNQAVSFMASLPGRILGALGNLGSLLVASGKALIQGFINGIKSMVGAVVDAARSVVSAARDLFPFSPAKKGPLSGKGYTTYSGRAMIKDWAGGMMDEGDAPVSAVESIARNVNKVFQDYNKSLVLDPVLESNAKKIADYRKKEAEDIAKGTHDAAKAHEEYRNMLESLDVPDYREMNLSFQSYYIDGAKGMLQKQIDSMNLAGQLTGSVNQAVAAARAQFGNHPFLAQVDANVNSKHFSWAVNKAIEESEIAAVPIEFAISNLDELKRDLGFGDGALSKAMDAALNYNPNNSDAYQFEKNGSKEEIHYHVADMDEAIRLENERQRRNALAYI